MGFKSFSGKKEIILPENLNCVMGPNGSGKSNVAEAICFALGKTSKKDLRAEKLGDLVFNGGKKLPPSKFAKVKIIIDNKNGKFPIDDDELIISRKVSQEGRSLYRVNGKRQTQDYVHNMLDNANIDPDGYNIVMQGEIPAFVEMSTEERRKIIENLSGISIYEEKKKKSMLKMDKVDQRLKEAGIIIREKERHMEELKKEKEQAEKFSRLQKEIRYKKALKIKNEIINIKENKDKINSKISEHVSELKKLESEEKNIVEKVNENSKKLDEINKKTEELGGEEQVRLTNQIDEIRIKINELNSEIKNGKNEIEKIKKRRKQIEEDIALNKKESERLKDKIKNFSVEIDKQKELVDKERDVLEKMNNLDRERVKINSEIHQIEKDVVSLRNELEKKEEKQKAFKKKKELLKTLNEKEISLKKILEEKENISSELNEAREKLTSLAKELHSLEGKKEVLFRLLNKGTRAILQAKKNGKLLGIHGIVSQLGKADEKYTVPLKIAAGGRGNSIVVDNFESAENAIKFLRKNNLGYATFLPMDRIKGREIKRDFQKNDGFVGYAIDLIKFDKKYEDIFKYVFSDTVIINKIKTAKDVKKNKYRMVTLKGDLIEKSGAMTGGERKDKSVGFKSESIEDSINKIKNKIDEKRVSIQALVEKEESYQDKLSDSRNEIFHIKSSIEDIEDFDEKEIQKVQTKLNEKNKRIEKLKNSLEQLPKKIEQEEIKKINERVESLQENLNDKKAKKQGVELELNVISRDLERSEGVLKNLKKEKNSFEENVKSNNQELKEIKKELNAKLDEEKKFHNELKDLYKERNSINEKNKQFEIKIASYKEKINAVREKINGCKLELAEINAKLEGRNAAMKEYEDLNVKEIKRDVFKIEKEIRDLEIKISNFGAVNMRALDVYKEVEIEYNELKDKYDKLESEKQEVLDLMSEIETRKKESFMESYKNVADNFERIFSTLSPGGDAKLILENEEDVFDGGIDIFAKHRGKKFISLRAMSGGEKTITTLAFIFAIQEYQPSPFYILDEVDAALDKENSEMLGKLLDEYSKKSQFIVVTHNDSVLSYADNIYGVHLNKLGESQIVSVKLPEK